MARRHTKPLSQNESCAKTPPRRAKRKTYFPCGGAESSFASSASSRLRSCRLNISATRVRKVLKHMDREREKTRAWRRVLEQTTGALLRQSASEEG